jgi:HEAT repeat protein
MRDGPRELRRLAAMFLATMSGSDVEACLREGLGHKDHIVRMNALHGLWLLRVRGVRRLVQDTLETRTEHPLVRAEAAEGLGGFRAPSTSSALLAALEDPSPVVRYSAIHALSELGEQRAVPKLERLAREDGSRTSFGSVRAKAKSSLSRLAIKHSVARARAKGFAKR